MLFEPHESKWLPRLEPEHANTLVALRWFLNRHDVERSLRMAAALASPWLIRGFTREGLGLTEEALALTPAQPRNASPRVVHGTALSRRSARAALPCDGAASQTRRRGSPGIHAPGARRECRPAQVGRQAKHRALARAREEPGPDASAEAWAAGARLSVEEAL
jgi:hypothetical protein